MAFIFLLAGMSTLFSAEFDAFQQGLMDDLDVDPSCTQMDLFYYGVLPNKVILPEERVAFDTDDDDLAVLSEISPADLALITPDMFAFSLPQLPMEVQQVPVQQELVELYLNPIFENTEMCRGGFRGSDECGSRHHTKTSDRLVIVPTISLPVKLLKKVGAIYVEDEYLGRDSEDFIQAIKKEKGEEKILSYTAFLAAFPDYPVGYICIRFIINSEGAPAGEIVDLRILEEYRYQGIGKNLIEHVRGIYSGQIYSWYVFADAETDSVNFYKKLGFVPDVWFAQQMGIDPAENENCLKH